ncbi:mitofilin family membrane protein [uncultured Pelagimonas sp.]|uniref:COG4223 family protein n=1 Tax=uncultured Pelagimonas sp. TaxID=1618102 RepID=UPI002624407E|nr:mitofilin family membrane protein [uncultured Pelagimonas sp.]
MAKSKRGKTVRTQSKAEESVETVETNTEAVVEDTVQDVADAAENLSDDIPAEVDAVAEDNVDDVVSDEPIEEVASEQDPETAPVAEEGTAEKDAPVEEDVPAADEQADEVVDLVDEATQAELVEPETTPEPQVIRETTVVKKSGFMSTALGGVVAAALGFGAAQFTDVQLPFAPAPAPNPFEEEARTALTSQGEQITALTSQAEETKKAVEILDLTPITASIAGIEDKIAGTDTTLKAIGDELAGFDSRLTAIEKAPLADAVSSESIAAYERELDALRKSITDQQAALEEQKVEIQAMAAEAMQAESNAEEKATLAASRAALAEVTALVQSGKPFAAPLAVLEGNGVSVPDALAAVAADGVPTLASLTGEFPDVARKALTVARKTDRAEGESGGIASFLQSQLGARSVTPREGDDPDAVLSRAEAAVKAGDLDAATTEVAALPEAAQAELADWLAQATTRKEALAATAALAQELNKQ